MVQETFEGIELALLGPFAGLIGLLENHQKSLVLLKMCFRGV
jgi:hypothetical protein